jgi:hypothetical protein
MNWKKKAKNKESNLKLSVTEFGEGMSMEEMMKEMERLMAESRGDNEVVYRETELIMKNEETGEFEEVYKHKYDGIFGIKESFKN